MPTELRAHHRRLASIAALQRRKEGWGSGRFAIEGPTLLDEALESGLVIAEVYATQAALRAHRRLAELEAAGTPIFAVEERAMNRISDLETPPGLLAVVEHPPVPLGTLVDGDEPVVGLAVADPGNAGTLLRSARAFGIDRIVFVRGGVDPYHPKVVRAAMGALFRMKIGLGTGEELAEAAQGSGRPIIAIDLDGEPLDRFTFPPRPILAIGHERHGVRSWLPVRDGAIRIPQNGVESLNAGVAGSIVLYQLMLARRGA
ncbi:MAG TPA: RNA methyltransferase [Candidatus Binatia bacterium]|nr:RNA methyltransferase [Candidatus Binatia bacterium]